MLSCENVDSSCQNNHDPRKFENEAKKGAESRIAGSYTHEVQHTEPDSRTKVSSI